LVAIVDAAIPARVMPPNMARREVIVVVMRASLQSPVCGLAVARCLRYPCRTVAGAYFFHS
jgi:hypothetical protein